MQVKHMHGKRYTKQAVTELKTDHSITRRIKKQD